MCRLDVDLDHQLMIVFDEEAQIDRYKTKTENQNKIKRY